MNSNRPTLLKREKKLAAVLMEYTPGKDTFKASVVLHQGGVCSLEIVDNSKHSR